MMVVFQNQQEIGNGILKFKIISYVCTEWQNIDLAMNVVSHKRLVDFYTKFSDSELPLQTWYKTVQNAKWTCYADVKRDFNSVDSVGNQRYVFNIKGNRYRLVVVIQFVHQYVYIRFVGTHNEYDKIDCETI